MNKTIQICFEFIMAGHAHVLISPRSQSLKFQESDCKNVILEPGSYFIFFNGDSTGGTSLKISVGDNVVATRKYPAGIFQDSPISIDI